VVSPSEHKTITSSARRELGEIGIDRAPHADRAREHVAVRMALRGVGRELAPAHELGDERVVVGELADPPAAHEIGAAVADVREREPAAAREQRDQRGSHPATSGFSCAVANTWWFAAATQ
jgi:hypothetical protein